MRNISLISLLLSGTILASCSLAPDFYVPDMDVPESYKEQLPDIQGELAKGNWQEAMPMATEDRGQWWKVFDDEKLNALEEEAIEANQSLKAIAARVEQSRSLAYGTRPSYLPNLDIGANSVRAQPPGAALAAFGNANAPQLSPYTLHSAQGVLSYEADLFGAVRDNYRSFVFDAEAKQASLRSSMLALQADVAQHYYSIRALDAERQLLRETVDIRKEAARIMQRRYEVGSVSQIDTTRTQSELAGVQAELIMLNTQRRQLENALAVLLGKMPSSYQLEELPLEGRPPLIPAGLPSDLLERRPDITASIASMAAANRRIGVARTAFFPRLILTASGGFQSTDLGDLFDWSNRTWALGQTAGSALAMSIFDSGRNFAKLDASKSAYEAAIADYRQQVLVAFKDVEDNLTAQRLLAEQSHQQETAADAATRTTELVGKRFDQGDVDYFQVVEVQRVSLAAQRAAIKVRGQRYLATISLIRALGGGWDVNAKSQKISADANAKSSHESNEPVYPVTAVEEPPHTKPSDDNNADSQAIIPHIPVIPEEGAPVMLETSDNEVVIEDNEMMVEDDTKTAAPFFESQFGKNTLPENETDADTLPDARLVPENFSPENAVKDVKELESDDDGAGKGFFDFDIEVVPANEALKDKTSGLQGTELNTSDEPEETEIQDEAEEKSSNENSDKGSLLDDVSLNFDWNMNMETVSADEAILKRQKNRPLMGTTANQ